MNQASNRSILSDAQENYWLIWFADIPGVSLITTFFTNKHNKLGYVLHRVWMIVRSKLKETVIISWLAMAYRTYLKLSAKRRLHSFDVFLMNFAEISKNCYFCLVDRSGHSELTKSGYHIFSIGSQWSHVTSICTSDNQKALYLITFMNIEFFIHFVPTLHSSINFLLFFFFVIYTH